MEVFVPSLNATGKIVKVIGAFYVVFIEDLGAIPLGRNHIQPPGNPAHN